MLFESSTPNCPTTRTAQVPFAEDIRRYSFPSLDRYVSKKGEVLTEHPYIPTSEMGAAMDSWVDSMDLTDAGAKDENGLVSGTKI